MKAITRLELKEMPFDKANRSGFGLVHATGYRVQLEDGTWTDEYDDGIYEDADSCTHLSEWDED